MEKYSVKKPFTVLVAVLIVFLMGFVSVTNLRTDLLPEMSTPYLMVVTVYPGASPEKVEAEVSEVLESALGTVAGVSSITSTSAENYSIVQLGFAADTDMSSTILLYTDSLPQQRARRMSSQTKKPSPPMAISAAVVPSMMGLS